MKNAMQISTPNDTDIVITRTFDAPRGLVWEAMTRPELLRAWLLGPPGWEMTACEEDLRIGGSFRWAWRGPDGAAMSMRGTYREVSPPERIVRTETFDFGCAPQAGEQVGTLVLAEDGGGARTTMTLTVVYPSKEARDGAIASGMEHGMSAGYDRLASMLADRARA